ncbi:MAG: helicase-related protein, partial [Dermatophilaceae bacterium]
PLKALLNNLRPRLASYAGWLGRSAQVRHGDTTAGTRKRQLLERPSLLLTTPESIEAMLVSTLVDPDRMFADLRAVVVDEVHAFAGDDRGWHLLAVLERVGVIAGRPLQRVGLSATVGNPAELLAWLEGGPAGRSRPRTVVAPGAGASDRPDLFLDYVGSVADAARVLTGIHRGEKRLVFADSRRTVESLAVRLRENEVDTFVSHSSLAVDERRRAEAAFAQARDCVIVSTSTLELGIDVGDLDRVIQLGAPTTVASVLQRLGRTGRRPGTGRNLTFLATADDEFLRAAALLLLLEEGFVEPVVAPPEPRHIAAQQLLGVALQKGRISLDEEARWIGDLGLAGAQDLREIARWLVDTGHVDLDDGLAFVGPAAELRYGRRNFRDLLAVFTTAPEVTVVVGRQEIGSIDPMVLIAKATGPRIIALAGRTWQVTHVDWRRHRAFVEPSTRAGTSRWLGEPRPYSFELANAMRRVLLGAMPVRAALTSRATERLARLRDEFSGRVDEHGTVLAGEGDRVRWWTFAGARANAVLAAGIARADAQLVDEGPVSNLHLSLAGGTTAAQLQVALAQVRPTDGATLARIEPSVSETALRRLKFSELLPPDLAVATLAARSADHLGALAVAAMPVTAAAQS